MAVTGYSSRQIGLHWIIAILIGAQYVLHGGMKHSWRLVIEGQPVPFDPMTILHIVIGVLVLLLLFPRIFLRVSRGAPPAPEDEGPGMKTLATVTQTMLYVLIISLPLSGMAAWFGQVQAAGLMHNILGKLLLLFVALHVAGAFFQTFVRRRGVLWRMFRPGD